MSNISQVGKLKELIKNPVVKNQFQEMLGKKSSGFLTSALSVMNDSKQLSKCEANSVIIAISVAASLDLPINPNLGFSYIVPYKQRNEQGNFVDIAQFQIGYKGLIQLAQRSGMYKNINVASVKDGEIIEVDRLTGEIQFDWIQDDDERDIKETIGYVAYFELLNGFKNTLYMTKSQIDKHAKKYSQTYKKGYGNWKDNFEAMAMKTVLKLMLSKFAPLSTEMQNAVIKDQTANDKYVDNEAIDITEYTEEEQRIINHINSSTDIEMLSQVREHVQSKVILEMYSEKETELNG